MPNRACILRTNHTPAPLGSRRLVPARLYGSTSRDLYGGLRDGPRRSDGRSVWTRWGPERPATAPPGSTGIPRFAGAGGRCGAGSALADALTRRELTTRRVSHFAGNQVPRRCHVIVPARDCGMVPASLLLTPDQADTAAAPLEPLSGCGSRTTVPVSPPYSPQRTSRDDPDQTQRRRYNGSESC
jgi:hypothetical protein